MANKPAGVTMAEIERDPYLRKEYLWKRWAALKSERTSWDSEAKDLAKFNLPRSSRFTTSEANKGGRRNTNYDNTALRDVKILGAGMMSGLTSPARPWFRLKHEDDALMEYEPVKVWCAQVTKLLLSTFARSNIYRTLHQGYIEMGVYGTHASILVPNAKSIVRSTSLTWGEYALAANGEDIIDTLYREMAMTAGGMVDQFGIDAVSPSVRNAYDRGDLDTRFNVIHAIEPNRNMDSRYLDWRSMPFRSVWFEEGGNDKTKYLRESGFRMFRGITPRWSVTGNDVYGDSPGMECLGDAKQLQHEQFRKAQGIDYMTKPPIGLPTNMKGSEVDALPGGVTYFDTGQGAPSGQRQLFDVNLNLADLKEDIIDVRQRIGASYFADLFLMISSMDSGGSKMTATEVAERHEEKLLMLGPVLERLTDENIQPLIDITYDQLSELGMLPPPPPELEGQEVKPELLGILAQAQRAAQTNTIDRFMSGVATVAQFDVQVTDKINGDMAVEIYADSLGVDPRLLADDDTVAAKRQARAKAQQAAQEAAQGSEIAAGAANLSGVPTQGGGSNAGADMLDAIGAFSGYQTPQAGRQG